MYQLFIEGLQRLGRALMLPIAILPIAGLLLRLGDTDLLNIAVMHDAGLSNQGITGIAQNLAGLLKPVSTPQA